MPDSVQLIDPDGQPKTVPLGDAAALLGSGWTQQTFGDEARLSRDAATEHNYGGVAGAAHAIAYAGLRGLTLGASDVAFRASGEAEDVAAYQKQFPKLSVGTELAAGLGAAFAAPGSVLARTPAGAVSGIGRKITQAAEGSGALARIGATTAGAAIEGGIYGGGQYLSQVALGDKPLAAEGFLGAMGKGALWAAPIGAVGGAALTLGEGALLRARSLFPKSQVTREAARVVEREATDGISQAVRDGDTMLDTARQRIAQVDAQQGAAQSAERASRAMFGAGDEAAAQNQVVASTERASLSEAVERYTQARAKLDDWIRAEADPDLEAALLGVRSAGVQSDAAPRLRVPEFGEVVPRQADAPDLGEFGLQRTSVGKVRGKGTPGPHEPPRLPVTTELPPLPLADDLARTRGEPTTTFNFDEAGLRFDPKTRTYHDAAEPPPVPVYDDLRARLSRGDSDYVESVVPARKIEEHGWYEPPGGYPDRVRMQKAVAEAGGDKAPTVALNVTPSGKVVVHDGHYVLRAAADAGKPVRVKWTTGLEPAADEVLRGGRAAAATPPPAAAVGDDLESLLAATRSKLDEGSTLKEIGEASPARAEYVAGKAAKTEKASVAARERARAAKEKPGDVQTIVSRATKRKPPPAADSEDAIQAALRKRGGKDVDIGPNLAAGAKAIGDLEEASAKLVDVLGKDAPATAVVRAKALRGATDAQQGAADIAAARTADELARTDPTLVDATLGRAIRNQARRDAREAVRAERPTLVDRLLDDEMAQIASGAVRNSPFEDDALRALRADIQAGKVSEQRAGFTPAGLDRAAEYELARRSAQKTGVDRAPGIEAKRVAQEEALRESIWKASQKTVVDKSMAPAMAEVRTERQIAKGVESAAAKSKPPAPMSAAATVDVAAGKTAPAIESGAGAIDRERADVGRAAPAGRSAVGRVAGAAAEVGTAVEVLRALGVSTPDISSIPVIGPVLAMYLRARAAMGIVGRRGGSILRSTEGIIAAKSSVVRDRINQATIRALDASVKVARRAPPIAGPAGALAYKLFPGDGDTSSKDPEKLYRARMDEIVRGLAPGAIERALDDKLPTADPELRDALAMQMRRGLEFLYAKAPKEGRLQSMLPGDGQWHVSRAKLVEWSRYVAAVGDPAGVIEDLANGHITIEAAETLRVVYPGLYSEAQRAMLERAPQIQRALPYARRVSLSLMFGVPVDATMTPEHLLFLQPPPEQAAPAPQDVPAGAPALSAPLQTPQSTMTSLERRSGV